MTSKLHLKENPTIQDFQEYVRLMKIERGFSTEDKAYECMLMAEEVGELFSAIRKTMQGSAIATNSKHKDVELEIADVLIYLCSIANQNGIDLEEAFRKKEEINKQRVWNTI